MLDINEELSNFIQQKERLYKSINKTTNDLKEAADGLKLPKLTTFFTGKCDAFQAYKCEYCNKIFPSRTSLGSHKKGCKARKDDKKTPRKTKQTDTTEMSIDTCVIIDK